MRIKTVDVDIGRLNRIEGLNDYGAVEILFRSGREPLGRARIPCEGDFLDLEKLRFVVTKWIHYVTVSLRCFSVPEKVNLRPSCQ